MHRYRKGRGSRAHGTNLIFEDGMGGGLVLRANPHGGLLEDVGEIPEAWGTSSRIYTSQAPARNSSDT